MQTYLEPPLAEWTRCVEENRASLVRQRERLARFNPQEIRRQLIERARSYTASLGLPIPPEPRGRPMTGDEVIVMAGHQPVVYHPGILFKNEMLSRVARECGGVGINVVIDTDEGDAGRLVWPRREGNLLTLHEGTLGTGRGLYRSQRVADEATVRRVFQKMAEDLRESGLADAAERSERVGGLYLAMVGEPLAAANSRVRAHLEERSYLEIPLSQCVSIPEVFGCIAEILSDGDQMNSLYNKVLHDFRREHKIKNSANPFPNLRREEGRWELPFWRLLTSDSREPLVLSAEGVGGESSAKVIAPDVVAPRGSMVTLLLRALCSDLFIHGRGGGTYDPFVDRFAREYWGIELPRFVVASRTEHLFPETVARLTRARELLAGIKEMISHTERFVGRGIFTSEEDVCLREFSAMRANLVEKLGSVTNPADKSATAHDLNELNRRLREYIEGSSIRGALADARIDDAIQARWAFREYPAWCVTPVRLR